MIAPIVLLRLSTLSLLCNLVAVLGAKLNLDVLPKPLSWTVSPSGAVFDLKRPLSIVVDSAFASESTNSTLSLIPPTLLNFAHTFATDVENTYGSRASVITAHSALSTGIFLTVAPTNLTLADGSPSTESYTISSSSKLVSVSGASPLAVFWATRTILQTAVLNDGIFPAGDVLDGPDYAIRGHMLDVGRHWYSAGYLTEICSYLSYFKMNEFHLHLSDNANPSECVFRSPTKWLEYYARFRLYSDNPAFAGLALKNESYDRQTFDKLQQDCAARGVTIIPEIEAPGHSVRLARHLPYWDTSGRWPTLLNLTIPASTSIVEDIWTEFLPWFHSTEVSIGADEYPSDLANEYVTFVNALDDHIRSTSHKAIRAWGTKEPSTTMSISKDVTIQHWALFDDDPVEVVNDGYPIINSQDWVFYVVIKYSTSYPPPANITRFFNFGQPSTGLTWNASLFNYTDAAHNPSPSTPLLRGAIAPVWNDNGPAASTDLEHYYETRELIPVSAALSWGAHGLTQEVFEGTVSNFFTTAPAQNLARVVKSEGPTILQYDFVSGSLEDKSGNGYNAQIGGHGAHFTDQGLVLTPSSSLETPLGSKGLNHTYTISLALSKHATVRVSGPDTVLTLRDGQAPTMRASNGFDYPLRDLATNATLPVGLTKGTTITFATTELAGTEAWQDGRKIGAFNTPLSHFLNATYYA
ncbi:glycoside hydrolase [Punctularia strigosozonata HHB-11173 SS5]|uniref:beta-N-acetylhexosaminidase n=1 Tax=Punctularia strigosozonata (strain HHB-11173) TaxID=741275 RepID=R7S5D6_PUNST|nr:glycoside hydrolase [Punctularia strigosozonata HHB-11173 SS5]EIN04596.1 glycoside hydrolase [Punctularia strigosozonata HHB-11173 SS5]